MCALVVLAQACNCRQAHKPHNVWIFKPIELSMKARTGYFLGLCAGSCHVCCCEGSPLLLSWGLMAPGGCLCVVPLYLCATCLDSGWDKKSPVYASHWSANAVSPNVLHRSQQQAVAEECKNMANRTINEQGLEVEVDSGKDAPPLSIEELKRMVSEANKVKQASILFHIRA